MACDFTRSQESHILQVTKLYDPFPVAPTRVERMIFWLLHESVMSETSFVIYVEVPFVVCTFLPLHIASLLLHISLPGTFIGTFKQSVIGYTQMSKAKCLAWIANIGSPAYEYVVVLGTAFLLGTFLHGLAWGCRSQSSFAKMDEEMWQYQVITAVHCSYESLCGGFVFIRARSRELDVTLT